MRILLISFLFLLLSGCATTEPNLKEVYIPVQTKCNDKPIPDKPELFSDKKFSDKKYNEIINGYQTDIKKLEVYADELRVLICK